MAFSSEAERLHRAFINTDATIDAGVLIDLCFLSDFDCLDRTCSHAGSTTSTFLFINFYCHNSIPRRIPDICYPIYLLPSQKSELT